MSTRTGILTAAVAGALLIGPAGAAECPDGEAQQAALRGYITAMQNHQFKEAYDFVTPAMTDGKSREEWAALQKLFYEGGGVNVLSMDIRAPHATDDDPTCAHKAIVPNVLVSRDKLNNQGTTEFETYVVVRDGDAWKVDAQETLFDAADIEKWFPGEEIPEFRDQY
jgi:hypothetical protein